jgi:hypothetical protein
MEGSVAKVPSDTLTINVEEVLRFFDEKPECSRGHATGVVGVIGEDLNTGCFRHYAESKGAKVSVKADKVNTGKSKGPRLDRWIVVDWPDRGRTVYQTEIKNWSAHAISGKTLAVGATPDKVADYKQERWDLRWDSQSRALKLDMVAKVLVQMKRPDGVTEEEVRPLLIFWEAIGPRDRADEHLFAVPNPTCDLPDARSVYMAGAVGFLSIELFAGHLGSEH